MSLRDEGRRRLKNKGRKWFRSHQIHWKQIYTANGPSKLMTICSPNPMPWTRRRPPIGATKKQTYRCRPGHSRLDQRHRPCENKPLSTLNQQQRRSPALKSTMDQSGSLYSWPDRRSQSPRLAIRVSSSSGLGNRVKGSRVRILPIYRWGHSQQITSRW